MLNVQNLRIMLYFLQILLLLDIYLVLVLGQPILYQRMVLLLFELVLELLSVVDALFVCRAKVGVPVLSILKLRCLYSVVKGFGIGFVDLSCVVAEVTWLWKGLVVELVYALDVQLSLFKLTPRSPRFHFH